jgi:orotate phosphoribosyltransferase-like protein
MGDRKKRVTEEVLKEMRNFREAGLYKKRIAEKLDLSHRTVFRYLREEGFIGKLKRKIGLR